VPGSCGGRSAVLRAGAHRLARNGARALLRWGPPGRPDRHAVIPSCIAICNRVSTKDDLSAGMSVGGAATGVTGEDGGWSTRSRWHGGQRAEAWRVFAMAPGGNPAHSLREACARSLPCVCPDDCPQGESLPAFATTARPTVGVSAASCRCRVGRERAWGVRRRGALGPAARAGGRGFRG
jgi:hypothetical protein